MQVKSLTLINFGGDFLPDPSIHSQTIFCRCIPSKFSAHEILLSARVWLVKARSLGSSKYSLGCTFDGVRLQHHPILISWSFLWQKIKSKAHAHTAYNTRCNQRQLLQFILNTPATISVCAHVSSTWCLFMGNTSLLHIYNSWVKNSTTLIHGTYDRRSWENGYL